METVELLWGDGTQDKLYIQISGVAGTSVATVTSDPNTTEVSRSKTVIFETTADNISQSEQVSIEVQVNQLASTQDIGIGFDIIGQTLIIR